MGRTVRSNEQARTGARRISTYIGLQKAIVQGCLVGGGLEGELEAVEPTVDGAWRVEIGGHDLSS